MRKKPDSKDDLPKKPSEEPPEELAPPTVTPVVERTEVEWQRFVDGVVDQANRGLRKGGLEYEGVADLLFKSLFDNDAESGLDPKKHATEAFHRLYERAGASLRLLPGDFVTYIRIGAMNQHRRDDAWLEMDWTKKTLLVSLLSQPNGRELIAAGIDMADGPNVGVRHVRRWVYDQVPKKLGTIGRPRGPSMTLANGEKFAKTGTQFKSTTQRRAFKKLVVKATPAKRRELLKDLRETFEGLQALLADLDDVDDE